MNETMLISAGDLVPARVSAPERGGAAPIPWLDGALFQHVAAGALLEIRLPDEADAAPVRADATVVVLSASGAQSPATSFDAIFVRGALLRAADRAATLAQWFDLLRADGRLVLALPQHADSPQMCEDDLRRLVETALPKGGWQILLLGGETMRHDPGTRELRLVVRRQFRRGVDLPPCGTPAPHARTVVAPRAEASVAFARQPAHSPAAPGMTARDDVLVRDFSPPVADIGRILVLKFDHHGDFIIGLPALRDLREAFPHAHIRLVCGRWNEAAARASGLVDEVRCFNYFPERAMDWTGAATATDWAAFAVAVEGAFDLAIDLRVDDDTRPLLGRVDARLRCGIGSLARFPMLDIALPDAARDTVGAMRRGAAIGPDGGMELPPETFASDMTLQTPTLHESPFPGHEACLLRSETIDLPPGRYTATFLVSVPGFVPGPRGVGLRIEVLANREHRVASRIIGRGALWRLRDSHVTLAFDSTGAAGGYEFRVHTAGRPLAGRLRFAGVRLRRLFSGGPRFRPSELHVGEKLSLLVALIRQRARSLGETPPPPAAGPLRIVVAPFSNSTVRDWPARHYASLLAKLAARFDCRIDLIGAPGQRKQAEQLLREAGPCAHVTNRVGQTQWSEIPGLLRAAHLVLCNNSGVAHQAAALGVRTLALYSASHQPLEWGPRGPRSRAIMLDVPCSPCGYERVEDCAFSHRCMQGLTPELVLAQIEDVLAADGVAAGAAGRVGGGAAG